MDKSETNAWIERGGQGPYFMHETVYPIYPLVFKHPNSDKELRFKFNADGSLDIENEMELTEAAKLFLDWLKTIGKAPMTPPSEN